VIEPLSAALAGRICGVVARSVRDLQRYLSTYPDLFRGEGFEASLLMAVAQANAFSAPDLDAGRLRMLNRTTLWSFALDWQVDRVATVRSELDRLTERCLAVADGGIPDPGDPLGLFLASLRDDLADAGRSRGAEAGAVDVEALRPVWRDELRRMLHAMTVEWDWRAGDTAPTVEQYLANADNLGSCFVNLSHWMTTAEPGAAACVSEVLAAARASQRVLRVVNDLGTYERDRVTGDLNILLLPGGADRARADLTHLIDDHQRRLRALTRTQGRFAAFLDRQVEFCRGFYPTADFWGEP
jgi:hypothetical protein